MIDVSSRLWTIPNFITTIRMSGVLIIWGGWLYETPWTLGLFVFLMCTDFIDGAVARTFNMKSEIGEILDPLADKLVIISGMIRALYIVSHINFTSFSILYFMSFFVILREGIVWIYRSKAKQKGMRTPSLFWGKAKVWAESIALVFLLATNDQWGVNYITYVGTISGIPTHVTGLVFFVGAAILAFVSLAQLKKTYFELFQEIS